MNIEKSCRNCRDNDNCCLLDKIDFDLETEVQCKLEEGIFEEVIKEELDLTDMFLQLQEEGIIKKNVKIKEIDDESIKSLITEKVSEGIWQFLIREMGNIQPNAKKMTNSDFHCSEWT